MNPTDLCGWYTSFIMETYGDGNHLAPLSSSANTFVDIEMDAKSMNLMDVRLEDEVNHIALLIKGDVN